MISYQIAGHATDLAKGHAEEEALGKAMEEKSKQVAKREMRFTRRRERQSESLRQIWNLAAHDEETMRKHLESVGT